MAACDLRTVRPNTHDTYERLARNHVAGRDIGAVPLRASRRTPERALDELEHTASRQHPPTRSFDAASCASRRRALGQAGAQSASERGPSCASLHACRKHGQQASFGGSSSTCADDRLYALWRLAATSGMRRGELLGLSHLALDLGSARLRVDRQLKSGLTFGPPKSRRGERTIRSTPKPSTRCAGTSRRRCSSAISPVRPMKITISCSRRARAADPARGSLAETFAGHRRAAGIPTGSCTSCGTPSATLVLTEAVPLHVVAGRLGDDPKTVLSDVRAPVADSDALAAETVAAAIVDKPLTTAPVAVAQVAD